jgi:hypothetical protein
MIPTSEDLARDLVADLRVASGLKVGGLLSDWLKLALQAAIRRALAAEGELRRLRSESQHAREEAARDS